MSHVEEQEDPPDARYLDEWERRIEYPAWRRETSHVVSGPLGGEAKFPGRRFASWQAAKKFYSRKFRIVETYIMPQLPAESVRRLGTDTEWDKRTGKVPEDKAKLSPRRYIFRVVRA